MTVTDRSPCKCCPDYEIHLHFADTLSPCNTCSDRIKYERKLKVKILPIQPQHDFEDA